MSTTLILTGTDKQIAWATAIRADAIKQIATLTTVAEVGREMMRRGYTRADLVAMGLTTREAVEALCAKIASEAANASADASWWIDHRIGGAGLDAVTLAYNSIIPSKK